MMTLTVDFAEYLVEVLPPVPKLTRARNALATNVRRKHRPATVSPKAHGFLANADTTFGQQIPHTPP